MAPANKAWRPTTERQITTRRNSMTAFRDRLIRFYVAGAENERKMFAKLVEYCIAMNINKTAYDRGIDHPTTGPLAKILQSKSVPVTAIFAYAIQQNPTEAKSQASGNPLMNLATERVSKLIGENGNDCFIPEDSQEVAAEAHDIITKVMATDPHFRYYGKEFVVRVEAAAKFPAPDPAGFLPVTSEMRYNMPILCPGDVFSEIQLILDCKDAWKAADTDESESLEFILTLAATYVKENTLGLGTIYDLIESNDDKTRTTRFALFTVVFVYAELKILGAHYAQYQGVYNRVLNARTKTHEYQLEQGFRPIVFGQQNVDTRNPRTTFRHHAWREPAAEGATWNPSPYQLPYTAAAPVDDVPWVIDIINPDKHWKRCQFPDNRTRNKTRALDIIGGFYPNDVDKEPNQTSQAILDQVKAQQPDLKILRWGVDLTKGVEIQPLSGLIFATVGTEYQASALPNDNDDMAEFGATLESLYKAQGDKPVIPRKGKQVASANDSDATSTPAPGDVIMSENQPGTENQPNTTSASGSSIKGALKLGTKRRATTEIGFAGASKRKTPARSHALDFEIQSKNETLAKNNVKFMELLEEIKKLKAEVENRDKRIEQQENTASEDQVARQKLQAELVQAKQAQESLKIKMEGIASEKRTVEAERVRLENEKAELQEKLRMSDGLSRMIASENERRNSENAKLKREEEKRERQIKDAEARERRQHRQRQKNVFRRMKDWVFGDSDPF